jgi:NAD(P)-dependent dehydrogenase (short-subunit alcohol dehydrogenase family)
VSAVIRRATARAVDAALEATVVGSFSRPGFQIRSRLSGWQPMPAGDLAGRVAIVTGATSGIGRAAAAMLAGRGATVCLVGRDPDRLSGARLEIARASGATIEGEIVDLGELAEVAAFATRFAARHARLDILVHNAGALSAAYRTSGDGQESTFATQVLAPFAMTTQLLPLLTAADGARVIVVASGGAYSERLSLERLTPTASGYNGVRTYARCKRAQVALVAEWTRRMPGSPVSVNAMHPGWVRTPGLEHALPAFTRLLRPILRRPEEGADTISWLAGDAPAAPGGRLFLDRRARATHRWPRRRAPGEANEAVRLWDACVRLTGLDPEAHA